MTASVLHTNWPRLWWRRVAQPVTPNRDLTSPEQPAALPNLKLTDDDVAAFATLRQQLTGNQVNAATARDQATALLLFVQMLMKPASVEPADTTEADP